MYAEKSNGLKIDPWGTPNLTDTKMTKVLTFPNFFLDYEALRIGGLVFTCVLVAGAVTALCCK